MIVRGYCSRWDFLLTRCRGRSVLHLGCVGETDVSLEQKLDAYRAGRVLHPQVAAVAREIFGIDIDAAAIDLIRASTGVANLLVGDAERLDEVPLKKTFDLILCGDLIEHLSCPGRLLAGVARFMHPESVLIISTPNAFSLLANVRFTLGKFHEGQQHVLSFSKFTLATLLERHGFQISELWTCYTRPPLRQLDKLKFAVGVPFFKLLPERAGTLLVVATKQG